MGPLTHGYAGEADRHLDRRYDGNGRPDSQSPGYPIERVKGEDEAEEILEYDHHGEALNSKVTCANKLAHAAHG